ncbi:MAG: T9SS type A sorting domain-containing protein [Flavobacteriales bacterium]|nr:T9SS type A sorting domain-containing protein [Flavobacteriales bacterium]
MQGGTEVSTVEWTGNLARWASADITFPGITVAGPTEYNAIISSPNGGLDEHPEGDEQHYELDVAPTAALATVNFELRTDQYANEITWKLFNPNGQVVAQDPAGNYANNTTYNYWWNLDPSVCYKLEVYDSYGDGIFSPGFYKVKSGGATLIQGGSHGSVGREKFSTGLLVSVEENALEAGLSVFPNPTAGILNINLELPGAASVEYTVHDILGKVVLQRTAGGNQGSQQVSLDMSGLANGSYVLNVVADGMSASRLVNLSK